VKVGLAFDGLAVYIEVRWPPLFSMTSFRYATRDCASSYVLPRMVLERRDFGKQSLERLQMLGRRAAAKAALFRC